MADVFTKAKRSDVMSRIRSRGNADTELALVRLLRAHKITGWRRHIQVRIVERGTRNKSAARPAGNLFRAPHSALRVFTVRPDFVFPKSRTAVFVDGCFWHGCPKHGTQPKGNAAFWRKKFAANKARDARVNRALRRAGWQVLHVWEHELKRGKRKAESGKTKASTPHPGPLPGRGGEGARARNAKRGTPAVVRRIQQALRAKSGE